MLLLCVHSGLLHHVVMLRRHLLLLVSPIAMLRTVLATSRRACRGRFRLLMVHDDI